MINIDAVFGGSVHVYILIINSIYSPFRSNKDRNGA